MAKASNLQPYQPPEDGGKDAKGQDSFSIRVGPFELKAVGEFLRKPGAWLGLALIVSSITVAILLLGDKIWRLFK